MNDQTFRAALKADAGELPTFDETLLNLSLPAIGDRPQVVARAMPSPSVFPRQGDKRVLWLGPVALAACVALAFFADRPAAAPEDLSASVAAVTGATAPAAVLASLPMQPYKRNLDALQADSQRFARFVTAQLDVLPVPG